MNQTTKFTLIVTFLAIALSGCATVEYDDELTDEASLTSSFDAVAYEQGVRDVLQEMRGRLAANSDYVFLPPIKECGVWIPTQAINGVVVPAHETCVVYAPGYYVKKENLYEIKGVRP